MALIYCYSLYIVGVLAGTSHLSSDSMYHIYELAIKKSSVIQLAVFVLLIQLGVVIENSNADEF